MILVPIESAYATSYLSPLWLWSYLAPFLGYGDLGLLGKKCIFFLPLSHSAPSLAMFPLEFRAEVWNYRVMGPYSSEDPMILAWVILTQCQRVTVTDRRTGGRTDVFTIASTALCIESWRAVIIIINKCWVFRPDSPDTVKLLLNAGSRINAGSLINKDIET